MPDICCPHRGGHLSYETFGQLGRIRKVGYNGEIQKRVTRVEYGDADMITDMLYCRSCNKDFDFEIDGETIKSVKEKFDYEDHY